MRETIIKCDKCGKIVQNKSVSLCVGYANTKYFDFCEECYAKFEVFMKENPEGCERFRW